MAIDVVTVWNQAISAAGGRGSISIETEAGREADLCRLWYPSIRQGVIKAASWPCAKTYASLGLLKTRDWATTWAEGDPAPSWTYAYASPTDLLAPRHLSTFQRFERAFDRSANTTAIMTEATPAILHYMFDQTDVTQWDVGLEKAIITALAAGLCEPLTAKVTRAKRLSEEAYTAISIAQAEIANEVEDITDILPSWVAARGYAGKPHASQYIYPSENFNVLRT